jgi:predicted nucleic acid-binding protein
VLVDTSVWIDHLHKLDRHLVASLHRDEVSVHSAVLGELALGTLRDRAPFLELLQQLPQVRGATDREVLLFVESRRLFGRGLGFVDAHLLASSLLNPGVLLWTRDRRLRKAAQELGTAAALP